MKKIKEYLKVLLIIIAIGGFMGGIGFVSYKIWRAEHPNAATWTFFIRSRS